MNNKGTKKKKTKRNIIVIVIAIFVAIILFFIIANNIVLNECASPCRHEKSTTGVAICPAVCDKVTLLDWILGNG